MLIYTKHCQFLSILNGVLSSNWSFSTSCRNSYIRIKDYVFLSSLYHDLFYFRYLIFPSGPPFQGILIWQNILETRKKCNCKLTLDFKVFVTKFINQITLPVFLSKRIYHGLSPNLSMIDSKVLA